MDEDWVGEDWEDDAPLIERPRFKDKFLGPAKVAERSSRVVATKVNKQVNEFGIFLKWDGGGGEEEAEGGEYEMMGVY